MAENLEQVEGDKIFLGNIEVLGEINNSSIKDIVTKLEKSSVNIQTVRSDFVDYIAGIVSDGIIDITEKRTLAHLWGQIETEYPLVLKRAADLGIPKTDSMYIAYQNCYDAVYQLLYGVNGVLLDMSTSSEVSKDDVANAFYNYYTAREALISGTVDRIVESITQTERDIQSVRMGDLVDGAIARGKLEAGFVEEHDEIFRDIGIIKPINESLSKIIFPNGLAKQSLPELQGQMILEVEGIANTLDKSIIDRDEFFVLTNNRLEVLVKDVSEAQTLVSSLSVVPGKIEAISEELSNMGAELSSLEVLPGEIEMVSAQVTDHGQRIGSLEAGYDDVTSILAEMNVGGEIINLSLIVQNADRIASIVSNGGYTDENSIFHPTKAYSEVQQLSDRFQIFIQGSGADAARVSAWLATKDEISQFVTEQDVDGILEPITSQLSTITETADQIRLQVSQLGTVVDQSKYDTREAYLAALENIEAQNTAGLIVAANGITLEVSNRENADTVLLSQINIQADKISAAVADYKSADSYLSSQIEMQSGRITAEVLRASGQDSYLLSQINMQSDRITAAVADYKSADSALSAAILVQANRIATEIIDRQNSESSINSQIAQVANSVAARIQAKTYNPNTGLYETATEAFMALQVKLPETMSADRRTAIAALLNAQENVVFGRLYESYTAPWRQDGTVYSEVRYRIVPNPIQADIDSLTQTFKTKGLLSSQFLVDAEEIMLKGTIRGEHLEMDSVSTSVFEAIEGRIQELSAKQLKVDTDPASGTDFEVYIDENNGILVKKNNVIIFSVNPSTGKVYLYGDADIEDGLFRGSIQSGPLTLNKSPPANSSFTISGSIALFLINLCNSTGLSAGTFVCSGNYGANTLGKVQFWLTKTAKTYTYEQFGGYYWKTTFWTTHIWERHPFYYEASIKLFNTSGGLLCNYYDSYETASSWYLDHDEDSVGDPTTMPRDPPSPIDVPASGGTWNFGSTGTLSFTAGAYTFKLENLPVGYSAGYAAGTAYLDENNFLKIKT